ncbi:MAG: electron transport complex subunit RsxC [Clostridiales bacterium]|nr:electron transport complex subunit RsxC [Clostridiales bacterium]
MAKSKIRGGVHPKGCKELSNGAATVPYQAKGELVFPLSQHIGKPAVPIVKKGDTVLAGQTIAKADGFISAPIISSGSGKVKSIEPRLTSAGVMAQCIVIDNDGQYTLDPSVGQKCDYTKLSSQEILDKVQAAGIVGLGGAGFPTHAKLAPKNPEEIEYVIANGAECEPYITCDDRLMQEHPDWVVMGLKVVLQLFPNAKGVIAIEDNKPAAIAAMQKAVQGDDRLSVLELETRYPQGGERGLVHAVTGQWLGGGGALPATLGCIVDNVTTLSAIYQAVCEGMPLMEKGFTVSGDAVANPGNFMIKLGTSLQEVLDAAGGLKAEAKKALLGGPMMGTAISSYDVPIVKANNALLCMTRDEVEEADKLMTACIRCGRCGTACPMGLIPQMMAVAAKNKDYARYDQLHGTDCIACGSCTYICPAKRPLTQLFKQTKPVVLGLKREGKL